MNLKNPITITPPPIKLADGTEKTFSPIVLDELKFVILDDFKKKTVEVRFDSIPYSMVLWTGYFYDKAGDYTQEEVEKKILETLGSNPTKILTEMFSHKVFATNFIPAVSGNRVHNVVPLSSRNIFSTYYTEFSGNCAFRANPYTFLMGISSIAPLISGRFVPHIRVQSLSSIHFSLSGYSNTFVTNVSSTSAI